jgi:hypothetical protein
VALAVLAGIALAALLLVATPPFDMLFFGRRNDQAGPRRYSHLTARWPRKGNISQTQGDTKNDAETHRSSQNVDPP